MQNPIIHLYRQRELASLLRTTGAPWFFTPGMWKGFDYDAMARSIGGPFTILNGYHDLPEGDPINCRRHLIQSVATATRSAGCTRRRLPRLNRRPCSTPTER